MAEAVGTSRQVMRCGQTACESRRLSREPLHERGVSRVDLGWDGDQQAFVDPQQPLIGSVAKPAEGRGDPTVILRRVLRTAKPNAAERIALEIDEVAAEMRQAVAKREEFEQLRRRCRRRRVLSSRRWTR